EELAEMLDLPAKTLSQVINESLDQHFFDFINQYRIEEAKRLLCLSKNSFTTILEVMYAAGFNSKSSFNTAFKKHTGTTPSQFRNRC
ncbi:MAG: helix-turn-helix domain-containing protein, partial [Saprospiraceae bacterium]|nr:helix-turn-helix domain-containing protein [Saprospiraceae bacterium]